MILIIMYYALYNIRSAQSITVDDDYDDDDPEQNVCRSGIFARVYLQRV